MLIIYGIVGRLRDQGIDQSKLRSSGVAAFLAVALPLIGTWEGQRNHAYLDMVGVPTICFGHTKGVQLGDYLSDTQCADLLEAEALEYREGLHSYYSAATKLHRLPPERDAAYVSLAYNVGVRGAGRSTATRRLNAGDIAGGCQALTWWNKAGGRVVRGLVRRRSDEYRLCMIGLG
ncbi:MAG: lysozyme [Rhodobacteraceae bacterium]|nr:lysozyme [Paracoccaceae bacterium]